MHMKSMSPGSDTEISAMSDDNGQIFTEPADLARLINEHWQRTFNKKETDSQLRREWLKSVAGMFDLSKEDLRPTRKDVEHAIKEAGTSAPGPDTIPFQVYRQMGVIAVDMFLDAANALLDGQDSPSADFNVAFMVCFPKAAEGKTEDGTQFYTPAGTRPISIVDASNRLFASIFKATLERNTEHLINQAQKGFLQGRQMLQTCWTSTGQHTKSRLLADQALSCYSTSQLRSLPLITT